MAQNHSTPSMMGTTTATSSAELLQAQAELWCHTYGYLKSMALQCAVKLGIPTAIHRCGGAASLSELHAALSVPARKRPCLSRVMKLLTTTGIFREGEAGVFCLSPVSRLLVEGVDGGNTCLSQYTTLTVSPFHFVASLRLAEWLENKDDAGAETPFMMAYGMRLYEFMDCDVESRALLDQAMGADSRFLSEIIVRECGEVFAGVTSLADVGGGDGTTAKAIAKAFPHVRCSVLELPQVVDSVPVDGTVEFVAGDMMDFIPPVDAVLLKFVLHNWSDEDCVRILKRSLEAISTREPKGKIIIIDTVVGSTTSKQTLEAQLLLDLCMMVLTTGEQRDEEKWHRLFLDAGFIQYKISPILGTRSLIEVYP